MVKELDGAIHQHKDFPGALFPEEMLARLNLKLDDLNLDLTAPGGLTLLSQCLSTVPARHLLISREKHFFDIGLSVSVTSPKMDHLSNVNLILCLLIKINQQCQNGYALMLLQCQDLSNHASDGICHF